MTGVTRGDGTEGEGGKRGEKGEEEVLACGRADGRTRGSARGPRGPKNTAYNNGAYTDNSIKALKSPRNGLKGFLSQIGL